MHSINEEKLEADVLYRFQYLTEFIGFADDDVKAIQAFAPYLGPKVPEIVDKTYQKLLQYDATARHFVPRQHGFDGDTPVDLATLSGDHPQIKFRKDHLNRYLVQLIGRSYDDKMVQYLDMVGKMHTPKAGSKELSIPLLQMNGLMGLLSELLTDVILAATLNTETTARTLRAFGKLLWIQNDLINRHYASQLNS
ncbi:MAG: protoglobin family protein [Planctomycetaceae bacterium]|nr:protoglobin family protein [Planctomycetaceae bacterium]